MNFARAPVVVVVVTLTLALATAIACDTAAPPIDPPAEGEGEGEGDEGEGEPAELDDALLEWSADLPNPYVFPGPDDEDGVLEPVGIDFFLQYTVALPDENVPAASLRVEACMKRASEEEPACSGETTPNVAAGGGGYRWGFDPSQYDTGLNIYEHTLTLTQGDTLLPVQPRGSPFDPPRTPHGCGDRGDSPGPPRRVRIARGGPQTAPHTR